SASPHVVEWIRQGLDVPVLIKFGSYAPRVHPSYEGRVSLVRITTLRLERLQLEDQGSYDCRILLLSKPTDEQRHGNWTWLSVMAPPTFSKAPPPVIEALVGSPISLDCVANGNPTPTITWLKDGGAIQGVNHQGGVFSLPAATAQSSGLYTCHASNSEGNVTHVTKVKVKGPPVIVIPPKSTTLNMSQNALLQCQAVADPPNMTYVWQKGGENVHHIEYLKSRVKIMVDGTLLISSLIPEDSGNYTCVPTNGLLTPPAASAVLTVMHPALALQLPQETYLPTGLGGVIPCPAVAQPPLLRVDWMKDGGPLDLSLYPGWTLKADGSLVLATVNEDAAGVYSCTPFNSYGSMGSSGSTNVILQDPPSFGIGPEEEYKQETGRTLLIPCQGNTDSTNKVTWSKVDPARPISYSIEPNGSLLLQPLIKDHQGEWECGVSNRVASIKTRTRVFVLGTSPHVATSLSVSPGVKEANVSWEAGFDGGSAQTFSKSLPLFFFFLCSHFLSCLCRVKKSSISSKDGKQDWFSVPVPPSSGSSLQVSGLSPATDYQFSILSQNKIGAGPFSEITSARTLDPPERRNKLKPPASLSANQGSAGVVLQWALPEAQQPPITGFVLQSRTGEGEWFVLDEDINANSSQMVVQGLEKDCVYELRMLSRHGELLSEPSPSVNVSTTGMESYPATSRLLEFVPEPLLAGVLGGVGFMCLALILLLGLACIISRKRDQRRRGIKDDPPPAIYKCSPTIKTSGSSTPDSLLKKSLLPTSSVYPTTSSITSSLQTDCSSFNTETNHRRKQLMSNYNRLTKTTSLISPSVEMISRGPDGRFTLPPYDDDTLSVSSKKNVKYDQHGRVRRSVSLHLEREDKKELPYVLSIDFPPCKLNGDSTSQMCDIEHHSSYGTDENATYDPDHCSLYSNSSLTTINHHNREITPVFPVLPHIRSGFGQPYATVSTLVLQMEHEREKGNLSRCLKLAQEREELERELQRYMLERNNFKEMKEEEDVKQLVYKYKSNTLPNKYRQGGKENLFPSCPIHREARPHDSHPSLIPSREHFRAPQTSTPSYLKFDSCPSSSFSHQTFLDPEKAARCPTTLPQLPSKRLKYERLDSSPNGFENSTQSTILDIQTKDSLHSLSHGNLLASSFHSNQYTERSNLTFDEAPYSSRRDLTFPEHDEKEISVEMSVDEPEFEMTTLGSTKPLLHQRIASHLQHGRPLTQRGRHEDIKRSTSFNFTSPATVENAEWVHQSQQPSEPELWRARSRGSKIWDHKRRSQSLDLRRQKKESAFLTPDAWIDSLSQENCSPAVYQDALKGASTYIPPINNNLEVETDGVPESGGSYSSYASSGRGSMETNNCSPETVEGTQGSLADKHGGHVEARRKPSVDEMYEWDAADFNSQPGDHDGLLSSSNLQKPAEHRSLPSRPCSNKAQRNPSFPGHQSSRSAAPEPDAVLF
ncbi:protein turtle homolog A, partial [Nematolebias whitei]|uniref:protein turtle homolog A n=1 Tax=Nematolebias whitei TaxID=451745 RepID=UPI00189A8177